MLRLGEAGAKIPARLEVRDAALIAAIDGLSLPVDRSARQKLEAAEDYIKEQSWKESARLIQAVLDLKED